MLERFDQAMAEHLGEIYHHGRGLIGRSYGVVTNETWKKAMARAVSTVDCRLL